MTRPKEVIMHTHAAPFVPLFDALFPLKEFENLENQSILQRKSLPQINLRRNGEHLLSVAEAHERLSLLVHLELPCTILIADPYQVFRPRAIESVDHFDGDGLSINGQDFKLHLSSQNFHTIRLVNHRREGDGNTSLDIYDFQGMLYASIEPIPDGAGAAVWRDVMENPSLSLP